MYMRFEAFCLVIRSEIYLCSKSLCGHCFMCVAMTGGDGKWRMFLRRVAVAAEAVADACCA
jgi:hypothetical protein